jgi:hypothetical protein
MTNFPVRPAMAELRSGGHARTPMYLQGERWGRVHSMHITLPRGSDYSNGKAHQQVGKWRELSLRRRAQWAQWRKVHPTTTNTRTRRRVPRSISTPPRRRAVASGSRAHTFAEKCEQRLLRCYAQDLSFLARHHKGEPCGGGGPPLPSHRPTPRRRLRGRPRPLDYLYTRHSLSSLARSLPPELRRAKL